jgi:HK97 family phage major capsid protein
MDIKQLNDEMLKTHTEFKHYVEKELAEVKKNGHATLETKTALEKMNTDMSDMEAKIAAAQKGFDDYVAKAARPDGESKGLTPEHAQHKGAFMQFMRKGVDSNLTDLERKAMSVGSEVDGGYLVPQDMSGRMIQKIYDTTPMRQISTVDTISVDSLTGPIDRDEAGAGWVSEIGSRAETTTPTVGEWNIPTHEIYAEPRVTQKLLDDAAFDVEAWLTRKVSGKFSRLQNSAFVVGNGIGKPRGFTDYSTAATADGSRAWKILQHIATGNNGDFPSSNPADTLFDVESALNPGYRNSAVWVMPRAVMLKVRKFKDTTNGVYLWQPSLQEGRPSLLMGYRIFEAEDMPALATGSLSLAFGNFREGYQIVDRIGIRTLRDPYTAKPYVKFYTTQRVGGDVLNFDAIKFVKFGS